MELDRFDKIKFLKFWPMKDVNLNELSERINLSVSSVYRRIKTWLNRSNGTAETENQFQ